ncbi:hypothetical protein NKR19_g9566 [Coniochaeta hoffmannii]|uniref:C2H2-type domain-containing protein n=1 Tax=Coniochaeta hoffmannii TaxID=91930 RepID=A0AA38VDB7_9PEZI|nr:hypothetical protein NKR19_g9566 [Coniochaeta hoffmannii]
MADSSDLAPGTFYTEHIIDNKGVKRLSFVCRACGQAKDRRSRLAIHIKAQHPSTGAPAAAPSAADSGAVGEATIPVGAIPATSAAGFFPPFPVDGNLQPSERENHEASPSGSQQVRAAGPGSHAASATEVDVFRAKLQSQIGDNKELRKELAEAWRQLDIEKQEHAEDIKTREGMHKAMEAALAEEIVKLKKMLGV